MGLTGTAIGGAGAYALTRVMKNLLFEVSATDPIVFVSGWKAFKPSLKRSGDEAHIASRPCRAGSLLETEALPIHGWDVYY